MFKKKLFHNAALALLLASALSAAQAAAPTGVKITEYQYNGSEFVEFTNFGPAAVDFSTYSFDDASRTPGSFSLAALGLVASCESVILSEASASAFRSTWNLAGTVKVIGGNTNNLGRGDEINLYDGSTLVDRLTYDDANIAGTVRTDAKSARPGVIGAVGTNSITGWKFSAVGDEDHSYLAASGGFIGSPGFSAYAVTAVPEPETYAMMLAGLGLIATIARKRRQR